MASYSDVIVLRHKENFAASRASEVSEVPVINAGDGTNEHPTQALLDFFTILMERGWQPDQSIEQCLKGLIVTMMGDLKHGRTVKSLSKLLRKFKIPINWVSPDDLSIPMEFYQDGDSESNHLNALIAQTDVLYLSLIHI